MFEIKRDLKQIIKRYKAFVSCQEVDYLLSLLKDFDVLGE